MGSVLYCDQTYKPSSVVNSHLSWPGVATAAHATFSKRAGPALYVSLRCCSEYGLHSRIVSYTLVSSYLAFPSLPQ